MSFRDFLDASYALMVESFTSLAANRIDLLGAVEKVESDWPKGPEAPSTEQRSHSPEAQMMAMLSGVKGAPKLGV